MVEKALVLLAKLVPLLLVGLLEETVLAALGEEISPSSLRGKHRALLLIISKGSSLPFGVAGIVVEKAVDAGLLEILGVVVALVVKALISLGVSEGLRKALLLAVLVKESVSSLIVVSALIIGEPVVAEVIVLLAEAVVVSVERGPLMVAALLVAESVPIIELPVLVPGKRIIFVVPLKPVVSGKGFVPATGVSPVVVAQVFFLEEVQMVFFVGPLDVVLEIVVLVHVLRHAQHIVLAPLLKQGLILVLLEKQNVVYAEMVIVFLEVYRPALSVIGPIFVGFVLELVLSVGRRGISGIVSVVVF